MYYLLSLPSPLRCRCIRLFVLLVWLCAGTAAHTRADTVTRETVVVGVRIGKQELPEATWGDIVIARNDSITLEYRCRISDRQFDPKLFDVTLHREDGQRYGEKVRNTSALWTGLAPASYMVTVQAFSPGASWKATTDTLRFRVDNEEAARRKRIAQEQRDTVAAVQTPGTAAQTRSAVEWGIYALVGIALAAGVGALIVQSVRQRRRTMVGRKASEAGQPSEAAQPPGEQHLHNAVEKDETMAHQGTLSYEQLQKENSALRAEIAALRGQIEALQVRTDELQKTNRDLAGQKERLLEHKRQLEDLQAQKDELFSMVVHDIKNPAGLIRGLVELLRSYDLTAQEQQEIMEDLMATSTRILALAQEVSRIVTLESGVLRLDFNRYPVSRIIEDVCRRNQAGAVKKSITIQRDTSHVLPDAEVDVQKLEEVLDNLVSNAIKFSDTGSVVKVKAYKSGENISVEVIDNGPGLTEEDIKRAFGRGARLSAKPTGGESSSGLGLWIVKKIVEAHRGRVWVKSSLLKGSTFAFEIPIVQPSAVDNTNV